MHSSMVPPCNFATRLQRSLRLLGCLALCTFVVACGFRMKGVSPLPFTTVYTNIDDNSEFGSRLRRAIVASSPNTRFVLEPSQAQALLIQLGNTQSLRELSINAQGRVEEYELNLEFVFELTDSQRRIVLPPTTLRTTQEIPYDDSIVQAKQGEIETVFRNMQSSLIDRIVRLLASPDVTEAFKNAEALPVDESTTDSTLVPVPAPAPWQVPSVMPDASRF